MSLRKTLATVILASTAIVAVTSTAQAFNITHLTSPRTKTSAPATPSTPEVGVCFYTEVDFGGRFFCDHGQRRVSEVDPKWRDDIESIQIINSASIIICEDFNRQGTCQTLSSHDAELSPELLDHLYSYKIKR